MSFMGEKREHSGEAPIPFNNAPPDSALVHLRRDNGSTTGKWLRSLVSKALDGPSAGETPIEQERLSVESESSLSLLIKWMGKLFDEFELYRLEFNNDTTGTDLRVNSSPPNLESTSIQNDYFEAHLTTRFWCMAFAASTEKIDVYLMPATLLLAFTTNRIGETEYKPFLTIVPRRQNGFYDWVVDSHVISFELMPMLAKELFGDLISVASGNMDESSLYETYSVKTGETPERTSINEYERPASSEPASYLAVESAQASEPLLMQSPSTHLSEEFLQSCRVMGAAILKELESLKAAQASVSDDMLTLMRCKQLTNELEALRRVMENSYQNLNIISNGRDAA